MAPRKKRSNNDSKTTERNAKNMPARSPTESDDELACEALFQAVEGGNDDEEIYSPKSFARLFVSSNRSKCIKPGLSMREQKELLLKAIERFSKVQARRFFAGLRAIVDHVASNEEYVPESAHAAEEKSDIVDPDMKSSEAIQFLQFAAICTESYFKAAVKGAPNTAAEVVGEVFEVALKLHEMLFQLDDCGEMASHAITAIVALCETWWLQNGSQRQRLVAQSLPFLAKEALGRDASTKQYCKRLHQMKDALELFDFSHKETDDFRSLLMRFASSPSCLKSNEGRRWLACLFQVDRSLTESVHQAMRVHIPENKKSILDAFGEVYFRAWKEANSTELRDAIETVALSDLMFASIHVLDKTMAKSILTVLHRFFDSKNTREAEDLLFRMYGPILWRSSTAANARVRANAAAVLAEVFPLQESSHVHTEHAIRKCCNTVKALLQDRDQRVRLAGSDAVASILRTYWDAVPANEIRALLNHLVAEHASDVSSPAVRAGAIAAITKILDASQSHAVLRALLPSLGNLIHDKVEKVRVATVQMLLKIKSIPGIKYYHVVPVDHLTARLAEDGRVHPKNAVASCITALMLNSYFPQGPKVQGTDQISRTLNFINNEPEAAAVFYANVSDHLATGDVVKLIVMLLRCLQTALESDQEESDLKSRGKKRRQEVDESKINEDIPKASNATLMAHIAETICILWESIKYDLTWDDNRECNEFLRAAFSGSLLTKTLAFFEHKARSTSQDEPTRGYYLQTCAAIIRSAAMMPPEAVQGLVPQIYTILNSWEDTAAMNVDVVVRVAILCIWGKTNEVAKDISASIDSLFDVNDDLLFESPVAQSKKRKSLRWKKDAPSSLQLSPQLALDVIGGLLVGRDPSSKTARDCIFRSDAAVHMIEISLGKGVSHAKRMLGQGKIKIYVPSTTKSETEFILSVCETYGRFLLHKQAYTGEGAQVNEQVMTILEWTTAAVLPALCSSEEVLGSPFGSANISRISFEKSFDQISPPGPPRRKANMNSTPLKPETDSNVLDSNLCDGQLYKRCLSVSLLQASCLLFAEWLLVGGASAPEVAVAAQKWCQALTSEAKREVMPGLCRLAYILAKTCCHFTLLQEILVCCHLDDGALDFLHSALASLLNASGGKGGSIVAQTVECVLDAINVLLGEDKVHLHNELPNSASTLWPQSGSVRISIETLLKTKRVRQALAQALVKRVALEKNSTISLFYAKCFWMLSNSDENAPTELEHTIRTVNVGEIDCVEAREVMAAVLEGLA